MSLQGIFFGLVTLSLSMMMTESMPRPQTAPTAETAVYTPSASPTARTTPASVPAAPARADQLTDSQGEKLYMETGGRSDGSACWFYSNGELARSGVITKSGRVIFDSAPTLSRCPSMD